MAKKYISFSGGVESRTMALLYGKHYQQEFLETVDFVSYEAESQNGL